MNLIGKMKGTTGYRISRCEMCGNFIDFDKDGNPCCKAYPDGIPEDFDIFSADMERRKCSDQYRYKEK
ncbi:MAG: hypothetical protein E7298_13730 [Lachnospiraceae bacterium]|nr:hypothetical protein [Lachnospiraceae bacterium]